MKWKSKKIKLKLQPTYYINIPGINIHAPVTLYSYSFTYRVIEGNFNLKFDHSNEFIVGEL